MVRAISCCIFFFNDTATTEIYTLSLHDALPISLQDGPRVVDLARRRARVPDELKCLGDRELSPALPETLVASMKIGADGGAEGLMEGSHLV